MRRPLRRVVMRGLALLCIWVAAVVAVPPGGAQSSVVVEDIAAGVPGGATRPARAAPPAPPARAAPSAPRASDTAPPPASAPARRPRPYRSMAQGVRLEADPPAYVRPLSE